MVANLSSVVKISLLILTVNCVIGSNAGNVGHVNLTENNSISKPKSNSSAAFSCNDYIWQIIEVVYNRTMDPFHALRLYNMIEAVINDGSGALQQEQLKAMDYIRTNLLWTIIVPRGSYALVCAANPNLCHYDSSTVSQWLDELHMSNETVSDLVIGIMVEGAGWTLPVAEFVSIMANFSKHLRQNVYAMLALHENYEYKFRGEVQMDFLSKLFQLKQHPDYLLTVSIEKQRRVDALFPATLQKLFDGQICLNQEMANGSRFYIHKCLYADRHCAHIYPSAINKAVFKVTMKGNLSSFNFRSQWYTQRPIYLQDGEREQPTGLTFNVFSPGSYSNNHMEWKVQLDDSQLVIQSMNSSLMLCAGNSLALGQGYYKEWFAYTRNSSLYDDNKLECRWNVEDCRGVY